MYEDNYRARLTSACYDRQAKEAKEPIPHICFCKLDKGHDGPHECNYIYCNQPIWESEVH